VGNRVVPEGTLRSITGFITLFFLTYIIATIAVAACGLDAETAGSAVVASLGNIGPGFGAVGPTDNYAELPYMVKTILTLCMLLGRLELMTLLAFLLPGAWRKT
jgi:trk system potassium uptake protein TrkH